MTVDDPLVEYWEQRLASEGMPAEPRTPLMRDTTPNEDGIRPWRGLRTIPIAGMDSWMQSQTPPPGQTEQLMQEPHSLMGIYTASQTEDLRALVMGTVDAVLSDREREVLFSTVFGSEPYESVAARMGLPKSTAYLAGMRARTKLVEALSDEPEIAQYLARHEITETQ